MIISICTDMDALRATGLVDEESPYRGMIDGRSGRFVQYSPDGTKSMIVITNIDGLEDLKELPFITVTSYEEIFGYKKQEEVDGVLQWAEVEITEPAYTPQIIVGYEDGDPIYRVERVETPTTRTVTDDEGNTFEVEGRPFIEYITTDEIEGYKQVPVYGPGEEVPEQTYPAKLPLWEEVPGNPELKALYDDIYPRTPIVDEDGVEHVSPKYFAIPGGHDASHLL